MTRHRRLGLFLLSVLLVCVAAQCTYPVEALCWHVFHGNITRIGGADLKLPLAWWRSEDDKDGTVVLKRARFRFSFLGEQQLGELRFSLLKPAEIVSEADWHATLLRPVSKRSGIRQFSETTPISDLHCVEPTTGDDNTIVCDGAPEFPWAIRYSPSIVVKEPSIEKAEADSILANAAPTAGER